MTEPTKRPTAEAQPGADAGPNAELQRQIDALSLTQALLDFEMANARVLDLTARLVEANQRAVRFGRDAELSRVAQRDAEHACSVAQAARDQGEIEHAGLRPRIAELERELEAHRAVIAARDADAAMFHREIAARDEALRARTNEVLALRSSKAYRVASGLARLITRR